MIFLRFHFQQLSLPFPVRLANVASRQTACFLTHIFVQDVFDSNNTRFERLRVEGKDDVYASIRQSTGPKLVTRTNDRIEMSGYLHFRSES